MLTFIAIFTVFMYVMYRIAMRQRRKVVARATARFDSAAAAIGFESRQVVPKPTASLTETARRSVPILSAFARYANKMSFPGMSGGWEGIWILVWESVEDNSPRTFYSANIEVQGPSFIIRRGKLLGAIADGSNEPSLLNLGQGEFANSFTTRGDDVAALNHYLTDSRQQAIVDLLPGWSQIELSNYEIRLRTREGFPEDVTEVTERLSEIAAVAFKLMSSNE